MTTYKRHRFLAITPFIYVFALDNILWAMKGHQIFDRFGFNSPESYKRKTGKTMPVKEYDLWEFDPAHSDWVNEESEELLSGYVPPRDLICLLELNIDLKTE